jgi:hypothetical protein
MLRVESCERAPITTSKGFIQKHLFILKYTLIRAQTQTNEVRTTDGPRDATPPLLPVFLSATLRHWSDVHRRPLAPRTHICASPSNVAHLASVTLVGRPDAPPDAVRQMPLETCTTCSGLTSCAGRFQPCAAVLTDAHVASSRVAPSVGDPGPAGWTQSVGATSNTI